MRILACHDCDLLTRISDNAGAVSLCPRCGTELHRHRRNSIDRPLAFAMSVRWTLLDAEGSGDPVIRRSDLAERTAGADHGAWVEAQQRNIEKLGRAIAETLLAVSR